MVMISAFASAVVLCRAFLADARWGLSEEWTWFWQHWINVCLLNVLLIPIALALTALGMIHAQPRSLHILKLPGIAACFLISANSLVISAYVATRFVSGMLTSDFQIDQVWWRLRMDCWDYLVIYSTTVVGLLIAVTWFLLRASGNWRSEAGWIDRSGRLIGACWIFYSTLYIAMFLCMATGNFFWSSPFWLRYLSSG